MPGWSRLLAAAALAALATPAIGACKLALALGLDISASVDKDEYRLQIDGLVAALQDPRVLEAILTPEGQYIEFAVYEWSGYSQQGLIVGWTRIDGAGALRNVTAQLRRHRRPPSFLATAIGKAVEFGGGLLRTAPPCRRRVLDISGDGINNIGVEPAYFYGRGDLEGAVVNGLVILGARPDPLTYYLDSVIFGPGAFVETAASYADFRRAMARKLLREIQPRMIVGRK